MARIDLGSEATNSLLEMPETGPGFQLVYAMFQGRRVRFLVLNAEQAVDLSGLSNFSNFMSTSSFGLWLREQYELSYSLAVAPSPRAFELISTRVSLRASSSGGGGSDPAMVPSSTLVKAITLDHSRKFHRFSPFNPDRRVSPSTGNFLPGTYACPESEVPFVPTGFAAVGRFALPSPKPASFHYQIEAPAGTPVLLGTVAPAYGQAGGGVEAFFPAGSANVASPAIKPTVIPED